MFTKQNIGYAIIVFVAAVVGWECVSICGGTFFLMSIFSWLSSFLLLTPLSLAACASIITSTLEAGKQTLTVCYRVTIPIFIGITLGSASAYEVKDTPAVSACEAKE